MPIKLTEFLSFLQSEVCTDFEMDKKDKDQARYFSKSKNLLLSYKPNGTELILTLSLLIQDSGQQFSIHLRNNISWQSMLQSWCKIMIPYLLDKDVSITTKSATEIADHYVKKFNNIRVPKFEDPDNESNYAISKIEHLDVECLNLLDTKQCWFEINNTNEKSTNTQLVRQISVPVDIQYDSDKMCEVLDIWFKLQVLDLDKTVYKNFKKSKSISNYKAQILVIIGLMLVWLLALNLAPI